MPSRGRAGGTRILVLDVGGSHVKVGFSDRPDEIKVPSGRNLTPEKMLHKVEAVLRGQRYDRVSIGYPGSSSVVGSSASRRTWGRGGSGSISSGPSVGRRGS